MKPQWRQMRLQWYATTDEPHISQGSSPASHWRLGPRRALATRGSATGRGGRARPSRFCPCPSPSQKKSDSQPMRRPVTLPKVPVAACREVPSARPARLRYPHCTRPTAVA